MPVTPTLLQPPFREFQTSLTKEFWMRLVERYPKELNEFGDWLFNHAQANRWDNIFQFEYVEQSDFQGRILMIYHLPHAMQIGVFFQYVIEHRYPCDLKMFMSVDNFKNADKAIETYFSDHHLDSLKLKALNDLKESIKTFDGFKKWIMGISVGAKYNMPSDFKYEWIKIEECKDGGEVRYSWTMSRNYAVIKSTGYVYPIISGDRVQQFKTEKGAKNSLIKYCEFIWG